MAKATIRVAKKKNKEYNPKKKEKINKVTPKTGVRLTGKTVVPNLAAMKKRKMITTMD
jgi:hypothetical protein